MSQLENSAVIGYYYEGFVDTDGSDDAEPVYWCRACSDCTVDEPHIVCAQCCESTEDDWITPQHWAHTQQLIACAQGIEAARVMSRRAK